MKYRVSSQYPNSQEYIKEDGTFVNIVDSGMHVFLVNPLSSNKDSININKMSKSNVIIVHSDIGSTITNCTTTINSPIITNVFNHRFKIGDLITVNSGFTNMSQNVINITENTVTVNNNATSNKTDVSITLTTSFGDIIDCRDFNSVSIEMSISSLTSGSWSVYVIGSADKTDDFGEIYDYAGNIMNIGGSSSNKKATYTFYGIPNYIQIKAVKTGNGLFTCKATLMNL